MKNHHLARATAFFLSVLLIAGLGATFLVAWWFEPPADSTPDVPLPSPIDPNSMATEFTFKLERREPETFGGMWADFIDEGDSGFGGSRIETIYLAFTENGEETVMKYPEGRILMAAGYIEVVTVEYSYAELKTTLREFRALLKEIGIRPGYHTGGSVYHAGNRVRFRVIDADYVAAQLAEAGYAVPPQVELLEPDWIPAETLAEAEGGVRYFTGPEGRAVKLLQMPLMLQLPRDYRHVWEDVSGAFVIREGCLRFQPEGVQEDWAVVFYHDVEIAFAGERLLLDHPYLEDVDLGAPIWAGLAELPPDDLEPLLGDAEQYCPGPYYRLIDLWVQ